MYSNDDNKPSITLVLLVNGLKFIFCIFVINLNFELFVSVMQEQI